MNYVIKNQRLTNYLYSLGFDYRKVKDRTGKQDFVYLFPNSDDLAKAISYYTQFKNKRKNK